MIVLLMAYLYKFHFKARIDKLTSVFKRQHLSMTLQPVEIQADKRF
jgi:hypothetical protein